jgi:hypothetical protein
LLKNWWFAINNLRLIRQRYGGHFGGKYIPNTIGALTNILLLAFLLQVRAKNFTIIFLSDIVSVLFLLSKLPFQIKNGLDKEIGTMHRWPRLATAHPLPPANHPCFEKTKIHSGSRG